MKKQVKYGDIFWLNFGDEDGTSIQRHVRPAVVISNDKNNCHSPNVNLIPLSAKLHKKRDLPCHVLVNGPRTVSMVLAEQIMTVPKEKLGAYAGRLAESEIEKVCQAIKVQLNLPA